MWDVMAKVALTVFKMAGDQLGVISEEISVL